jgi:L-fucose mutarotase
MPVDEAQPVVRMAVAGDPDSIPDVQREVLSEAGSTNGTAPFVFQAVDRWQFYDAARKAFAVVLTGERRFYGCFVFTKGVVAPATTSDTR